MSFSIGRLSDLTLSRESHNGREKIEQGIYAQSDRIQYKIEKDLNQVASNIKSKFESDLNRLRLSKPNLILIMVFTISEIEDGNTDCWKVGYFRLQDIKDAYDARRNVTTEPIDLSDRTLLKMFGWKGQTYISKKNNYEPTVLQ